MAQQCKFAYGILSIAGGPAFIHGFHMGFTNMIIPKIMAWYVDLRMEVVDEVGEKEKMMVIGMIISAFSLGGVLGSLGSFFPNLIGRKPALLVMNGLVLICLLLLSASYMTDSFRAFLVGRFMVGICAGLSNGMTPMYLIEVSPCCLRGTVGSFYGVMVTLSALYAYINGLDQVLGDPFLWPYIFIGCIPVAIIHMVMLLFVPDSPKYYYFNQEDEDDAAEAIAWFEGENIDHELDEYIEEAEVLEEVGKVNLLTMFTQQVLRSPFIITTVILLIQPLSGIDTIMYYSTYIFQEGLGYENLVSEDLGIGLAAVNVGGTIISMILMDKVGRRNLLLGSIGGMMISLTCFTLIIILARNSEKAPPGMNGVAAFFLYVYVLTYGLGTGTIPWFYVAELNNHYARPWAAMVGLFINWLVHFTIVISFLPVWKALGNYVFLIFVVFDIFAILFVFFTMRETMDMELSDIAELFFE